MIWNNDSEKAARKLANQQAVEAEAAGLREEQRIKEVKRVWDKLLVDLMNLPMSSRDATNTFEQRLKDNYGWSEQQVTDAIFEYKRFIALVAKSDELLVPSALVDQVWTMHLLFSRHYVSGMCVGLLRKFVHRKACADVNADEMKVGYARTLDLYRQTYGEEAGVCWSKVAAAHSKVNSIPRSRSELISNANSSNGGSGIDPMFVYLILVMSTSNSHEVNTSTHVIGLDGSVVTSSGGDTGSSSTSSCGSSCGGGGGGCGGGT